MPFEVPGPYNFCAWIVSYSMKQLASHLYPSLWYIKKDLPKNSVSKESACNAGDLEAWVLSLVGKLPWRRERLPIPVFLGSPCGSSGKEYACNTGDLETWVWSLGREAPLEKGKATYSSVLAWRSPRTLQSMIAKNQTRLSDFHFSYMYLFFFRFFSHSDFYRALSRVLCAIQ